MDISGQQHLVPRRERCQHHGVDGPAGPVHHEIGGLSAVEFRCQRLSFGDAARRMVEIIQFFHEGHISPQSFGSNELPQPRMGPQPLLMPRRMKRAGIPDGISLNGFRQRRPPLIPLHARPPSGLFSASCPFAGGFPITFCIVSPNVGAGAG